MADDLLGDLLRQVSRSFYLSLAILPRPLREPIGLAYLLARAADTVADTRLIVREERVRHVETLRRASGGAAADVAAVARACAPRQAHAAERRLLEHVDEALARLEALPAADRAEVRAVVATLTTGMVFDLTRFPGEDAASLTALDTPDELDRYTYLVAGCVGPFWTALHAGDPASRVADAARVRVAPLDRPRDARRARRETRSPGGHDPDQDSSACRARAPRPLGAHRLVRRRARRRRRTPQGAHRPLT